jgi:nucleotide-binding universal stress UspA family protein
LVGIDFSDADAPAFEQSARIAHRVAGSELHLVHVFSAEPSPERSRTLVERLRVYVNREAPALGGLAGITVGIHFRAGRVARQMVQLASEIGADLIVVGSHRGLHRRHWVVGPIALKLMSLAACPVLVACPWPKEPFELYGPIVEPPCPDCIFARAATGGSRWWCEGHSHRGSGAYLYSHQRDVPLATLDSPVFPKVIGS